MATLTENRQAILDLLLASSDEDFLLLDARGKILGASRKLAVSFGYEPEKLTGKAFSVLAPEELNQQPVVPPREGNQTLKVVTRTGEKLHTRWLIVSSGPQSADDENRLLAAYLDRPLIPENFSARESLDSGRSLDDWRTFYQGGTRLVECLQHAGYNALMITVLADGSTIYPSEILQPTPRYDTGVFASGGSQITLGRFGERFIFSVNKEWDTCISV